VLVEVTVESPVEDELVEELVGEVVELVPWVVGEAEVEEEDVEVAAAAAEVLDEVCATEVELGVEGVAVEELEELV